VTIAATTSARPVVLPGSIMSPTATSFPLRRYRLQRAVREWWAKAQGIEVKERGRVPADLVASSRLPESRARIFLFLGRWRAMAPNAHADDSAFLAARVLVRSNV